MKKDNSDKSSDEAQGTTPQSPASAAKTDRPEAVAAKKEDAKQGRSGTQKATQAKGEKPPGKPRRSSTKKSGQPTQAAGKTENTGTSEKTEKTEKPEKPEKKTGGKAGLLIAILALLLAGAAGAGLYLLQQQSVQQGMALASSIDELRDQLQADIAANRQQLSALETLKQEIGAVRADVDNAAAVRQRIEGEQEALNTALAEMSARMGRTSVAWKLAEVEYLLIVANARLTLERDRRTALVALQTADQQLRGIGDPALVPVRQTIAREMTALKAMQEPDITGMALRLSSLSETVEGLPLVDTHPPESERPAVNSTQEDYQSLDWADIPRAVWRDLRGLVVVRRLDKPIEPLLPPAQEWYLRQNLQLKLEQARLSLLRHETELYRRLLSEAEGWLKAWFDPDSSAVKGLQESLQELQQADLRPELPDISESLRVLRGHMQRLGVELGAAQDEGGEQ